MSQSEEKSCKLNDACQHIEIEDWSDNHCYSISLEDNFPLIVNDTSVQKNIVSRFLNFYLSGKIPKGLTIGDLVFAVISIMPISLRSEEFIFKDENYSEDGTLFFLTAEDKVRTEINTMLHRRFLEEKQHQNLTSEENCSSEAIYNSLPDETELGENNNNSKVYNESKNEELPEEQQDNTTSTKKDNATNDINEIPLEKLQWYRNKRDTKNTTTDTEVEYGANENASFCISCNKLLNLWDTDIEARTQLKYFFGLTGLILMRGKVKSYQNLNNFFVNQFLNNLVYTKICYSTPHKAFVKKVWKAFHEPDHKIQIMFSKLVITSFVQTDKLDNFNKQNILKFAVLSHTADFGLGIICMLQIIASVVPVFHLVFKVLYSKETAESWNRVNRFFKNYMYRSAHQFTYHWARIIQSEQFRYLSCHDNYAFAVVTAVFIEQLTKESGVWQAVWVKSGKDLESYKELGLQMYNEFKEELLSPGLM